MLQEFRRLLDEERGERPLQAFLQCYPTVLIQILRGGHTRWAIPQKRLGERHITDFILGEFNSLGYHWYPVELESPAAELFTKSGDPTKALMHALRQIHDWRLWLNQNLDYARRSRVEGGLELKKIRSNPKGIIFIGRRHMLTPDTQARREQMSHELRIDIHTFDHLFDTAQSWSNHIRDEREA
jgi:Shedu protein SduA, C-terminal